MESAIVNGPKHTDVSAAFRVPKDLNLNLVDSLIWPDDFYCLRFINQFGEFEIRLGSPCGEFASEDFACNCLIHGEADYKARSGYLRAKRSKSAICEAISSRAASEAERMPWMRSLNSSALDARARASSSVMSCLV